MLNEKQMDFLRSKGILTDSKNGKKFKLIAETKHSYILGELDDKEKDFIKSILEILKDFTSIPITYEYDFNTERAVKSIAEAKDKDFFKYENVFNYTIVFDLPRPIRDFGDLKEVWRIKFSHVFNKYTPHKHENNSEEWSDYDYLTLANGCYFATEEDAQANCDWLMNR